MAGQLPPHSLNSKREGAARVSDTSTSCGQQLEVTWKVRATCLWGFRPSPMLSQPSPCAGWVTAPSSEQRPQPATCRCTALGPPVPQSEDCARFWGSRGLPLSPHLRGSLLLCPW